MAKAKAQKEGKNAKGHLKARLEYLQRAAKYLHNTAIDQSRANTIADGDGDVKTGPAEQPLTRPAVTCNNSNAATVHENKQPAKKPLINLARVSVSQMRGVSLKTQTRLPVPVKRSFCKKCDTLLTPEVSCKHELQNASRGRKKPWAEVLVVRCVVCGTEKRFPRTDRRSRKLPERQAKRKYPGTDDAS